MTIIFQKYFLILYLHTACVGLIDYRGSEGQQLVCNL